MEPLTTTILTGLVTAAVSGGVAAVGSQRATKATLNGTKERVERIETKLDQHMADSHAMREETIQRITALETKVNNG